MDLRIKDHVALVQGASKGIGRGIAEALAAEGCDLLITARELTALERTANEISARTGRRVIPLPADTANLHDNEHAIQRAREAFGRLDILVCNSGGPKPGGLLDLAPDDWRAAAELLLIAPAHLLKTALPLFQASPAPRFFVVTSSSTKEPVNGLLLSNSCRPGVVGMIKTLASELAPQRVRCHSLAPGRIDTDRLEKVIDMQAARGGKTPDAIREGMLASIPAGRFGSPSDLGTLAAFLASPLADYLTGGNWIVDGGMIKSI